MEKILHITSGKGPLECERAAYLILRMLEKEAKRLNVAYEELSMVSRKSTFIQSGLIRLRGKNCVPKLVSEHCGTILWQAQSPFRPQHKRKNWFVSLQPVTLPEFIDWNERDVKYESLRASGPGGQHVNKTESAVRATHVPTGISVVASDERSQSMNKAKATERLRLRLVHLNYERQSEREQQQWREHAQLERGNAKRVILMPLG